jgi:limonene-1,2-epoxide hydrolase
LAKRFSDCPACAEGAAAEAVVRALVDAWNSKDVERICTYFHDDFENDQAPLPLVRGLSAYREHLARWFATYPDLRLEIVSLFAKGSVVCLETRALGSPRGSFFGVEPKGGRTNRALDVLELRGGKVWRQRGYWDFSLWTGYPSPLVGR